MSETAGVGTDMDDKKQNDMNTDGKRSSMKIRIALALAVSLILLVLRLCTSRNYWSGMFNPAASSVTQ